MIKRLFEQFFTRMVHELEDNQQKQKILSLFSPLLGHVKQYLMDEFFSHYVFFSISMIVLVILQLITVIAVLNKIT